MEMDPKKHDKNKEGRSSRDDLEMPGVLPFSCSSRNRDPLPVSSILGFNRKHLSSSFIFERNGRSLDVKRLT